MFSNPPIHPGAPPFFFRQSLLTAVIVSLITLSTGCMRQTVATSAYPEPSPLHADPIEDLVARLATSPFWRNGIYPHVDLPETASAREVLAQALTRIAFGEGPVETFSIVEMRQVHIHDAGTDLYTAVRIQTAYGEKIVLFKYKGPVGGWWSRVYDTDSTV